MTIYLHGNDKMLVDVHLFGRYKFNYVIYFKGIQFMKSLNLEMYRGLSSLLPTSFNFNADMNK